MLDVDESCLHVAYACSHLPNLQAVIVLAARIKQDHAQKPMPTSSTQNEINRNMLCAGHSVIWADARCRGEACDQCRATWKGALKFCDQAIAQNMAQLIGTSPPSTLSTQTSTAPGK